MFYTLPADIFIHWWDSPWALSRLKNSSSLSLSCIWGTPSPVICPCAGNVPGSLYFSFNVGPETRRSSPDTTSPCWIKTKYHFPWDASTAVMIMFFCKAVLLAHTKFCAHQDPQVFLRKVAFQTVCPQEYTIIWDGSSSDPELPISLSWASKKLPTESSKWISEMVKDCWKSWNFAFCPAPCFQDFKFHGHCIQIFSLLSYPCAVLPQSPLAGSC